MKSELVVAAFAFVGVEDIPRNARTGATVRHEVEHRVKRRKRRLAFAVESNL